MSVPSGPHNHGYVDIPKECVSIGEGNGSDMFKRDFTPARKAKKFNRCVL